jgi:hypothetical protein
MFLHTLTDGTNVKLIDVRNLIQIHIWKHNRFIDYTHVKKIKAEIANKIEKLDHGYWIANIPAYDAGGNIIIEKYIIDGQHRIQVLRDYFATCTVAPHFNVLVFEKSFDSEAECIEYFNAINNIKPLEPYIDENLILNNYIAEFSKTFNINKKVPYIRNGKTCRPYLSSDKLRTALQAEIKVLPKSHEGIKQIVQAAKEWNTHHIMNRNSIILEIKNKKTADMFLKGADMGFILGYDDTLQWIKDIILPLRV